MSAIALFGAGGKMGYRLASNFKGSRFDVRHVEISDAGKQRLKSGLGLETVTPDVALDGAEVSSASRPSSALSAR